MLIISPFYPNRTSSMGFLTIFILSFFIWKDIAKEIGPIRPRYIVAVMISLPQTLSADVKFLVKPTVAVALTVS